MSPPAVRTQMADPAAWAVTAFATTSFMLGIYQTGILNAAGTPIVLPAAFFFGGVVQIIVAVLEVSRGNLFGAAVFGNYGPLWVMFGAFETLYAASVPAAQLSSAALAQRSARSPPTSPAGRSQPCSRPDVASRRAAPSRRRRRVSAGRGGLRAAEHDRRTAHIGACGLVH